MSRRAVREAWLAEVRRSTEIGDACRVLLLTMAAEGMTEKGYVSIPRTKLADLLGRHPQRITERIGEAIKAGFLVRVGGKAYEGKTANYAANFPPSRGNGKSVSSKPADPSRGNGSAVTSDRLPLQGRQCRFEDREVTAERLANTGARVRATKTNREEAPAPVDSRVEREHDGTSQTVAYGSWLPAPVDDASFDSTEDVA